MDPMNDDTYDDFDPSQPYLERWTVDGNALSIPWSRNVKMPLSCFDSTRMLYEEGPWVPSCPFEVTGSQMVYVQAEGQGRVGSYVESSSTTSSTVNDHLSASVGVAIGYPFLSAGPEIDYDRNVLENKNGTRMSRTASCRLGRVIIDKTPTMNATALKLLRHPKGQALFKAEYGDYYLYGYEIGVDAGASLCAESSSKTEEEVTRIRIKVKLLFIEVETPDVVIESYSSSSSASMTFCGYSTLDINSLSLIYPAVRTRDEAAIQQKATLYQKKLDYLYADVIEVLRQFNLANGERMPLSICGNLCQSGVVVRLLLAPFARLNEYVANK